MDKKIKKTSINFIQKIIQEDLNNNKWNGRVITRFPPEPNGFLHLGHAKSICLNFELANEFKGHCYLRFDDTNPIKESIKYVESIIEDIEWLGYDWNEYLTYTSDYFDQLYNYALILIQQNKAYVDDQSAEEIRYTRGTLTKLGINSPYRNRSIEENLILFQRMAIGDFQNGSRLLRAKINMQHPNLHMRDPALFRIRKVYHQRTVNKWHIYPMYDYAHCISDSIEGITHSICTLEFEDNRILYDWFLNELNLHHPQQIEFARLNLEYTIMSKRNLLNLVKKKYVNNWDDPRMPTIKGLRRRGYPPEAIQLFCKQIGVGKKECIISLNILENSIRNTLNPVTARVMGILNPLKIIIINYPEEQTEEIDAPYFPDEPSRMSNRKLPFSREIYIEREDFSEKPSKNFWRLAPNCEVRLRWAYFITCIDYKKNPITGEIEVVYCSYDSTTKGGHAPDGRTPKGTIHWVSITQAFISEIYLYDRLFKNPQPNIKNEIFKNELNLNSLKIIKRAILEPNLVNAKPGTRFQFERNGYYYIDPKISLYNNNLIFNRIVTLRNSKSKN